MIFSNRSENDRSFSAIFFQLDESEKYRPFERAKFFQLENFDGFKPL